MGKTEVLLLTILAVAAVTLYTFNGDNSSIENH
jgi:hypothetical protein